MKKVDMQSQSITSSTTDRPTAALKPAQQNELIELLQRGASPAGACQQIGIDVSVFAETLQSDVQFRERITNIKSTLTQNVETALYQAAMKGNVSAQKYWLELYPPANRQHNPEKLTRLDKMTFDEILKLSQQLGIEITADDK